MHLGLSDPTAHNPLSDSLAVLETFQGWELRRCFGAWDTEQLQGFSREQLAELLRRLCPELDEAKRKMALRPQRVRPAAGEPRVGGEPAVGRRDDEWTMVSRERVGEQVR
ncbi:unnamed protein product [Durusdinium trenchii]|uniref:Exonuclease domain-containing protein n=2 Tax=Durusdinium trenchii TaxID=1381693 RepID=A0ABP0MII9_9DINO